MRRNNQEYHKKRFQAKKPQIIAERRAKRIRLRKQLLEMLGGKCVKCGFSDERALQIDHIHGGGHRERLEQNGSQRSQYLITAAEQDFQKFLEKFQLLCANCNWIKRQTNNEVRH